jgi:cyclic-di-GMP-binding protein
MVDGETHPSESVGAVGARTLGLRIPRLADPPSSSPLLDPRATAKWINSLPMANIGESARQVYQGLLDFNRYRIPDLTRARVIELFRAPVDYICRNLHRHYVDVGFPLSDKAWKTAVLSRELNAELAISYKIVVEHMVAGDSDRFDRKLLVISLHRALHYLGQVLLQFELIYAPPHAGLWREINSLYAYSLHNHVHQVPIKMKFDDEERISTIEDSYKSLLLLAAASPNRLRQTQIKRLSEEVRLWAAMTDAELENDDVPAEPDTFTIDLNGDKPPSHRRDHLPPEAQVLCLDLHRLLKHLRTTFQQDDPDQKAPRLGGQQPLPRALLQQLIVNWGRPPKRRFVRTRLNFELDIVVGLLALHETMSPDKDNESEQPAQEERESQPSDYLSTPYIPGVSHGLSMLDGQNLSLAPLNPTDSVGADSMINDSFLNISPHSMPYEPDGEMPKATAESQVAMNTARTLNESAGGYCIDWSSLENAPKLKVGELVGISSAGSERRFSVCATRWLSLKDRRRLEVGLQLIGNQVTAASLRPADKTASRRNAGSPVNALVLANGSAAQGHPPSIIVSGTHYNVGARLWLDTQGQQRLIRLTRLAEMNSTFTQFHFVMETEEKDDKPNDEMNFDDLWNSL